jgi:hypothetical protein
MLAKCFASLIAIVLLTESVTAQQQPLPGPAQPGNPGGLPGQPQVPEPEVRTGAIKAVEVKGRLRKLVVTGGDGTDYEIPLTPMIQFEVRGIGDEGFLRPGQMLYAQGTLTNKRVFVTELTVQLLPKNRKPVPGRMEKAPRMAGLSTETYRLSGPIISFETDPDYPTRQAVIIRTAGPSNPILLEPNCKISVVSDDLDQCTPGTPVELEGRTDPRNGRFQIGRVSVLIAEPLVADELLGPVTEDPKKKN